MPEHYTALYTPTTPTGRTSCYGGVRSNGARGAMIAPWTFLLLKPDAARRRVTERVSAHVDEHALSIRRKVPLLLSADAVDDAFGPFTFKVFPPAYAELLRQRYVRYLTSGPCEYWEIEGPSACDDAGLLRRVCTLRGESFYPERCAPGTLRFDFGDERWRRETRVTTHVEGFGEVAADLVENLVHSPCSEAERDHQSAMLLRAVAPV